jgi:uncharacterized integral membrane protein
LLPRLLLLPLLSPLLAILLVGALNPRPPVSLRLLIWRSPALPLGAWIAGAATAGAALSGSAAMLALRQASPRPLRRQVRGVRRAEDPDDDFGAGWEAPRGREAAARREAVAWEPTVGAGPTRAAGEPAPTVSVPFRVIRRGSGSREPVQGGADRHTPFHRQEAQPIELEDDWDMPASDAW